MIITTSSPRAWRASDGGRRVLLDPIGHGHQPGCCTIGSDEHGGPSLGGEIFGQYGEFGGVDAGILEEPGVADEYLVVLYLSPDPLPGHRLERSRPGHVDRSILDPEMIGSGERLFGVNLDGRPKLRFRQ